jgi:hypothetical protein
VEIYKSRWQSLVTFLLIIALSICWTANGFSQSKKKIKKEKNRLDQLVEQTVFHGQPFIKSYTISEGSAQIQLNARLWNSLSAAEQRQICDMLAGTDVWKKMGLLNAYLYVYRTNIGRIGPNWSGGFEFKPALKSLE